jgi:hypothetical protein
MLLVVLIAVMIMVPSRLWLAFVLWVALWVLMLVARAIVSIWRNRNCYPASFTHNVRRAIMVVAILAVLDAAAIIGWFQWLFLDALRGNRKAPLEAGDGA